MKTIPAGWLCFLLLFCGACREPHKPGTREGKALPAFRFQQAVIVLSDSADGAAALSMGDAYTRSFTTFDLQGRLGRTDTGGREQDYLRLAASQCQGWSAAQQDSLKASFAALEAWLKENKISLKLPDTVRIIHSKCEEELGSDGYTRRNLIVLNGGTDLHLISHELFHVLSRHNPALRDKLYAIIGFRKCAPIRYQEAFGGRTITNPDCPVVEHYTVMRMDGFGREEAFEVAPAKPAALVLYSTKSYTGGNVFADYLKVGCMMLSGDSVLGMQPMLVGDRPVLTELTRTTMPAAVKALRVNTMYLLHPEEICAEHFSLLVEGESVDYPDRLTAMRETLQQENL